MLLLYSRTPHERFFNFLLLNRHVSFFFHSLFPYCVWLCKCMSKWRKRSSSVMVYKSLFQFSGRVFFLFVFFFFYFVSFFYFLLKYFKLLFWRRITVFFSLLLSFLFFLLFKKKNDEQCAPRSKQNNENDNDFNVEIKRGKKRTYIGKHQITINYRNRIQKDFGNEKFIQEDKG